MKYLEWSSLKKEINPLYPLCNQFFYPDGSNFYLEPMFYTQLNYLEEIYPDKYPLILKRMEEIVLKNKRVVFTHDYETPYVKIDGYIYQEITDILDPLHIYVEDKSRGSDYGD